MVGGLDSERAQLDIKALCIHAEIAGSNEGQGVPYALCPSRTP